MNTVEVLSQRNVSSVSEGSGARSLHKGSVGVEDGVLPIRTPMDVHPVTSNCKRSSFASAEFLINNLDKGSLTL